MTTIIKSQNLITQEVKIILQTQDFVHSIAYCKQNDSLFYSNNTQNNISDILPSGENIVYKRDRIKNPRNVFFNSKKDMLFFEDDIDCVSGFYIPSGITFSRLGFYLREEMKSRSSSEFLKFNRFAYVDKQDIILVSQGNRNIIDVIDNSGKSKRILGSGKKDYCLSNNPLSISFNRPTGICFCGDLSEVLIVDTNNKVIRRFSTNAWKESQCIGKPLSSTSIDGEMKKCSFVYPTSICCFDKMIYLIDEEKNIKEINLEKQVVKTIYSSSNLIGSISCSKEYLFWTEI